MAARTGGDPCIPAEDPHLWQRGTCLCLRPCVPVWGQVRAVTPRLGLAWAPCTPKASVAVPRVGCQRVQSPLSPCTRCSRVGVVWHAHPPTLSKHVHTHPGSLNATAAHPPCARWRWHACGCVPALHARVPLITPAGARASRLAAARLRTSTHLCAGASACVSDLVRPRLCERLSSPFFRSAVNCNQIKAANHLGPLKRAYVP